MADITFWTGPISIAFTKDAILPGSTHRVIECRGSDFTPLCQEFADGLLDANGRRLPNLLIRLQVDVEHMRDLVLAAFSNGGVALRRIITHADDRALVRAVMLADATYTSWGSNKLPYATPAWVTFGAESATGTARLLVATASPIPDRTGPSGVQTLRVLRAAIEERTGLKFEPIEFFGIEPKPEQAYRLGNVVFAEYPEEPVKHGGHVELAKQTFAKILVPWIARGYTFGDAVAPPVPPVPPVPPEEPDDRPAQGFERWVLFGLCAVGAGATAYTFSRWWRRRRRP